MPLFMIERKFADRLDPAQLDAEGIRVANEDAGVEWLYSFLSADKRKTYCLYEVLQEQGGRPVRRQRLEDIDVGREQLRPVLLGSRRPFGEVGPMATQMRGQSGQFDRTVRDVPGQRARLRTGEQVVESLDQRLVRVAEVSRRRAEKNGNPIAMQSAGHFCSESALP